MRRQDVPNPEQDIRLNTGVERLLCPYITSTTAPHPSIWNITIVVIYFVIMFASTFLKASARASRVVVGQQAAISQRIAVPTPFAVSTLSRRYLASDAPSSTTHEPATTPNTGAANGQSAEEREKELADLKALVAKFDEDTRALKEKALRAYADAENARVIAKRDVDNAKQFAVQKFAKGLLDVADIFDRALESVPEGLKDRVPETTQLIVGLELTKDQLIKVFAENGVTKVR